MNTRLLLLCAAFPVSLAAQDSCRSDLEPADYSLASRVDSAAFVDAIDPSWFDGEELAVLLIAYDSPGAASSAQVHSLSHQGIHPQSSSIEAAFLRLQRPGAAEESEALVLYKGNGLDAYFLKSVKTCQPKIKNTRAVQGDAGDGLRRRAPNEIRNIRGTQRFRTRFSVHVGTDGAILEIRMNTSSGNSAMDRAMHDAISDEAEFEPGYVEGIPVSAWARFPLTLQFRTR